LDVNAEFSLTFKEENMPIQHYLFQKTKKDEIFLTFIYEARITLILKPKTTRKQQTRSLINMKANMTKLCFSQKMEG
jgi:hypothetical protein